MKKNGNGLQEQEMTEEREKKPPVRAAGNKGV
jgi:hypothetical protein